MSIVGYGDYYPQSHPGRLIIIFTSFWGVFLISMCIVSVGNYRNFYSTEKQVRLSGFSVQAFKILFRLKMRHQLQCKAANVIAAAYRVKRAKEDNDREGNQASEAERNYQINMAQVKLHEKIREFARHRELLKIESTNRNLMIKKLIDKVTEDLGAVSFIIGSIKEIEVKTDFLLEEQKEDIKKMNELYKNFQVLEIMLNRLDYTGPPGPRFIQCKTFLF